jgi:uncharacterized protein (TIGR03437 family)
LGGGTLDSASLVTAAGGRVSFNWSPVAGSTLLAAVEGVTGGPAITPGGVVNGASFGPRLGIGAYVTIFGERLAGAQLRINGALVPALFTSDKQVNFLSPATLSPGPADISVETPLGISIARVEFNTYAPGIFVPAAGFIQAGAAVQAASVYATGVGLEGESVRLLVDGVATSLVWPGFRRVSPGLYEFPLDLPPLSPGTHGLSLTVNGISSNTVKLQVGLGN